MYEYRCRLVKVVDGDTIDVDIDLGFDVWLNKQRIRLADIDAPESRTRDAEEKKYGLLAKDFVVQFCTGQDLILKTKEYDAYGKFGRILGEIYRTESFADESLNEILIKNHHAVRYFGQSKDLIQEEHLKNRQLLNEKRLRLDM